MEKPRILLVDDDKTFLELLPALDEAQSYDIVPVSSALKALDVLAQEHINLVISDVQMPNMTGTELFQRIQDLYPEIPVILITAFGSTEDAITAVKQGAFHYFEKPINDRLDLFWTSVREALSKGEMLKELTSLRREKVLHTRTPVTIIGQSEVIRQVLESIDRVAPIPVSVLICGETGTGKELVARAIHHLSDRKEEAFIAVNCNEFAAGVLESELFGHERGAFTGAVDRKTGLFDVAHKGILFLDEISEAPAYFQSKLLRVLETKTYMRVGGTTPIYSEFRLLASSNRNLEEEIARHRFRQDLFYRINVYTIVIPPLRDRKEDIPLIAEFYLERFRKAYSRPIEGISTNAMLSLREYEWPGNIRELINVIERAVITCRGNMITSKHLPFFTASHEPVSDLNLRDAERFFVDLALRRTQYNKTRAADLLGISRKTLIDKIKAYKINEQAKT